MSDPSSRPPQPSDLPIVVLPFCLDYDLSKLKDFMNQQVESYIEKGIIAKDEGDTIKRIYSSL